MPVKQLTAPHPHAHHALVSQAAGFGLQAARQLDFSHAFAEQHRDAGGHPVGAFRRLAGHSDLE